MLSEKLLDSLREYVASHLSAQSELKRAASARFSRYQASVGAHPAYSAMNSSEPPGTAAEECAAAKCCAAYENAAVPPAQTGNIDLRNIQDYVDENRDPAFSCELMRLIDESGCRDSEIYARAGIDRRHFSKIRSNPGYHPGKTTAAAFCLALRLDRTASEKLLSSAGYSFSSSEIFDLIILFCIENGIYDLNDVNTALVYFSLRPIGAVQ